MLGHANIYITLDLYSEVIPAMQREAVRLQPPPLLSFNPTDYYAPDDLPRFTGGVGAGRGARTPKSLRTADFKSAAYANFAIPAGSCQDKPAGQLSARLCR